MVTVDLRPIADQLPAIIEEGIADVLETLEDRRTAFEAGEVRGLADPHVSAFGLYIGMQGLFCVVQADGREAQRSDVSKEHAAQFANNMPDWRWYLRETEFEGPGYCDFPHQDDLMIIGPDGSATNADLIGDREIFDAIATLARPVLASYLPFNEFPRSTPFRVGIQPIGGRGEFWLIRDEADKAASDPLERWVSEMS